MIDGTPHPQPHAPAPAPGTAGRSRRAPQQQRSRDRVEAILAAAHGLIVEAGSDSLKMSEIASRAGVPIGSVYQYFPDKPAILRELVLRFMASTREVVIIGVRGLATKDEAIIRVDQLLAGYYQLFLSEPEIRDIWASTQSDKELQQLDIDDSRANGQVMADSLTHLAPARNHERLRTVCFLFAHLTGATARLAIAVDPAEGERLMLELRVTVRRHLEELLAD